MKRAAYVWLCICVLLAMFSLPVSAAIDRPLLAAEQTVLATDTGEFAYTESGALQLTAPTDEGAVAAVVFDQLININTIKYLQLCVESTAPFNIALKISGGDYDVFPQTAGPSWYESFQPAAPADGEGVAAGMHTMSLDLLNYFEYNDLDVPEDGFVTLGTVYVFLKGAGTVTVHHLAMSDTAEFTTAGGQAGVAATTYAPITTDTHATKLPTRYNYESDALGGAANGIGEAYANGAISATVVVILIVAGLLIIAVVLFTVAKKHQPKDEWDDELDMEPFKLSDDDEFE